MNFYLYYVTIFDRSPNPNLNVFPRREPHTVVAESRDEAQRQIVEFLYDRGVCAMNSHDDDPADRFGIVFDDEPWFERPVEWDESRGEWVWEDEPLMDTCNENH